MEIRKNGERERMTREEAIEQLQNCKDLIKQDGQDYLDERDIPLLDMAINALAVLPQYKWERDIAVEQLDEYGIPFGAKKDDDVVKVVRCKDCKHRHEDECPMYFEEQVDIDEGDGYYDTDYIFHDNSTDNGYCSWGERREDGE